MSKLSRGQRRELAQPEARFPAVASWSIAGALALLFGSLSHWKVFEFDAFFDSRWGREILESGQVQRVDTWSHTAYGLACINFEWLSTVVIHLATRIQEHYAFLGWLRSWIIAGWMFACVHLIQKHARSRFGQWAVPALLAPWIYVICSFRLQMRPDLFATAHYAALLVLWHSDFSVLRKRSLSLALLLSWANFHAGTAPIGIFVTSALITLGPTVKGETWRTRVAWCAAMILSWFLTPIGFGAVGVILDTMFHFDQALWQNPDFQPLSLRLFEFHQGGWVPWLWVIYVGVVVLSYFYLRLFRPLAIPALFRPRWIVPLIGGALTLQMFNKIRIIHYQVIFFLPLVAAALGAATDHRPWKSRRGLLAAVFAASALIWGFVLPDQVRFVAKPLGSGLDDNSLPIESTEFIRQNHPERNLLNAFAYGGYLVAELPEYPVSMDGRGPFEAFMRETRQASTSAEGYAALLRAHSIQTVLEQIPNVGYDPQRGMIDGHESKYPPAEWALVHFDNASVVYLRRTPAHQAIIQKYEYHFIRRGLPPAYESVPGQMAASQGRWEAEFDRCLAQTPRNVYCLDGKAAFVSRRKNWPGALELLERAHEINPHSAETLFLLAEAYDQTGHTSEARRARKNFDRLTKTL